MARKVALFSCPFSIQFTNSSDITTTSSIYLYNYKAADVKTENVEYVWFHAFHTLTFNKTHLSTRRDQKS